MTDATAKPAPRRVVGRYAVYHEVASGGMATVHLGRLMGPVGFARTVAIKRLYAQYAKDPDFVAMFLDEARLAARIQHPNVVQTLDVVPTEDELFLVMEYVAGDSLARLLHAANTQNTSMPPEIVASVIVGALHGLHAAHEAKSERGEPLDLVHRDVSPQNVLVGIDGIARVLDFGVAKAAMRAQITPGGLMKGKLCYMSPEQVLRGKVDRRADVFAAGIVLWEALTGTRLFDGNDQGEVVFAILNAKIPAPSTIVTALPESLDAVAARALSRDRDARFQDARQFAIALEKAIRLASPREVGEWVETIVGDSLAQRAEKVGEIECISMQSAGPLVRVEGVSPHDITATGIAQPAMGTDKPSLRESETAISIDTLDFMRRQRLLTIWGLLAFVGLGVAVGTMLAMRDANHATRAAAASSPAGEVTAKAAAPVLARESEPMREPNFDGSSAVPTATDRAAAPQAEPHTESSARRARTAPPSL